MPQEGRRASSRVSSRPDTYVPGTKDDEEVNPVAKGKRKQTGKGRGTRTQTGKGRGTRTQTGKGKRERERERERPQTDKSRDAGQQVKRRREEKQAGQRSRDDLLRSVFEVCYSSKGNVAMEISLITLLSSLLKTPGSHEVLPHALDIVFRRDRSLFVKMVYGDKPLGVQDAIVSAVNDVLAPDEGDDIILQSTDDETASESSSPQAWSIAGDEIGAPAVRASPFGVGAGAPAVRATPFGVGADM